MNKIVREHYPVENLPEDLRSGLTGLDTVTVTIDARDKLPAHGQRHDKASWTELLERIRSMKASGAIKPITSGEAVDRVRALRDEWDS